MMRRLYTLLRGIGYLSGLSGLWLFTTGRQGGPGSTQRATAGAALLIVAMTAFFGTYVIWVLNVFSRRTRPPPPPRENGRNNR